MFGPVGPTELIIILLVVLLLFGARKLPELARALGSSISQFKRGLADDPHKLDQQAKPAVDKGKEENENRS
jgi:sec-independent protein translocase protein TatA